MEPGSGYTSPSSRPALSCPAGNCVVLKPSEISKNMEQVLAEVLPRYLDQVSRAQGRQTRRTRADEGQAGSQGLDRLWHGPSGKT